MYHTCTMCPRMFQYHERLASHIIRAHKHDPNFRVYCKLCCGISFTKWNTFLVHMKRKHKGARHLENAGIQEQDSESDLEDEEYNFQEDLHSKHNLPGCGSLTWSLGRFVLFMKERHVLTQVAIDDMMTEMERLVLVFLNNAKKKLLEKRLTLPEWTDDDPFTCEKIFAELKTVSQQKTFFKQYFNMMEVEKAYMGSYYRWKVMNGKPVAVKENAYAYYIPFLKSLERLLNNNEVLEEINKSHSSNDGILRDICDGTAYINHPILGQDNKSLGFLAYYDDVETSNPLGSKAGFHKVSIFYWVLINLHPAYRSSLRTIQLLGIAKTKYIRRFGPKALMNNFMNGLKELAQAEGCTFNIHGQFQSFRGALIAFPADTLASNFMGGFKESPSFAIKPCRLCHVRRENLGEVLCEHLMRNHVEHREQVRIIENTEITPRAQKYWSKQFGIVRRSVLDDVPHFDVTKGLVLDTMHVLFHGVLAVEIQQFLQYCIYTKKFFNLDVFNNRLSAFTTIGSTVTEKPCPIDKKAFAPRGTIKQKAVGMWELGLLIPFLVESFIPDEDEHLENYVQLQKIVNICTAFSVDEKDAMLLSRLSSVYVRKFIYLYPDRNATPKLHYLQHLGWQIGLFGPLRYVSCFRFEGKHAALKTVALTNRNFKNIPLTLVKRHEGLMALNLLQYPGNKISNYLYAGDIVQEGNILEVCNFLFGDLLVNANVCNSEDKVMCTDHIAVHGRIYKKSSVLLLDPGDDDENLPEFGQVESIVVHKGSKYLIVEKKLTREYNGRLNAYEVDNIAAAERFVVDVNRLKFQFPVFATIYNKIMHVITKNYSITDFS